MSAPELDLDELEQLELAASSGPFEIQEYINTQRVDLYGPSQEDRVIAEEMEPADARLYVAVRNALPQLIARLRAAEAIVASCCTKAASYGAGRKAGLEEAAEAVGDFWRHVTVTEDCGCCSYGKAEEASDVVRELIGKEPKGGA